MTFPAGAPGTIAQAPPRAALRGSLPRGLAMSVGVHVLLIGGLFWWISREPAVMPQAYRVQLIGAPPGPRQAGVVNAAEKPAAPRPPVSGAERPPAPEKALPNAEKATVKASPKATPSTAPRTKDAGAKSPTPASNTAPAPRAGAGAVGGKGADVANVDLKGIAFPYQGYLNNIVRQLTLSWNPRSTSAALVAEVKFMIRRDGSVAGIEVIRRSGDRIYDLDAMGAVEAVGTNRDFGPLPSGWQDDVLVVYFKFDYAIRP